MTAHPHDPCGRTWICLCDHKGRIILTDHFPPVIGSASLDRGLSEWHPVGCSDSSDSSDLSDLSDPSATGTPNLSQYLLSTLNITIFVGR